MQKRTAGIAFVDSSFVNYKLTIPVADQIQEVFFSSTLIKQCKPHIVSMCYHVYPAKLF